MTPRLPPDHATVARFIGEHAERQLQFVIELAHQNSFSWNKEGTDRVAAMVLEEMGGLFPEHRVVEQSRVGNLHLLSNRTEGKGMIRGIISPHRLRPESSGLWRPKEVPLSR